MSTKKVATPRGQAGRRRLALAAFARLRELHPDAHCELAYTSPFQLLVAVVLSAQTTDRMVNQVTPALFARYGSADALALAPVAEVEHLISRLGFFRQKAKNLVGLSRMLVERHGGEVPRDFEALVALPGVGRKTANVVLGVCFGEPEGVVVDTHVLRLSQRLGWATGSTPEVVERELTDIFSPADRDLVSHVLIFHGRRVCRAVNPGCDDCGAAHLCPSAGRAEGVGRKPPRKR